jgi:hypothetical protein
MIPLRFAIPSLAALLTLLCPAARAVAPSDVDALVISHGTFTRDGKQVRATIGNLVPVLQERFPRATILIAGARDVTVNDLILPWHRRVSDRASQTGAAPDFKDLSLEMAVSALQAASGDQFNIKSAGPEDYILSRRGGPWQEGRVIEAFNLRPIIFPHQAESEAELRALKDRRAEMATRYADKHPALQATTTAIARLESGMAAQAKQAEQRVEDIRVLIRDSADELLQRPLDLSFKFHPGSSLLVVIGPEDAIQVARKVVNALTAESMTEISRSSKPVEAALKPESDPAAEPKP